jgi:predicted ATP-grasp superfamily ATP-dependent carboligase
MRALIVDSGKGRAALAASRALDRGGWHVGMAGPSRAGLPMLSRSVDARHVIPPRTAGESAFLEGVRRAVVAGGYEIVFGCGDGEILSLSRARETIDASVPHAPHEVLVRVHDKIALAEAAERSGIAAPPSASSAREARERWGEGPAVVKERLHAPPAGGGRGHFATLAFPDVRAAGERVSELQAAGAEPVVQPLLEGELMAFSSVVGADGEMLARIQQVAERTYPLEAGLSARARTIEIDESLAARIVELLRDLGWFGVSELQFIVPPDGPPVLLDFNGRFYGSLALGLAAGINLPDTWARIATGRTPREAGDARPGVRYQWLEGDLRAAREHRHGARREVLACLQYRKRRSAGIWSATDPLPGLLTAGTLLGLAARRSGRPRKLA